MGKTVLTLVCAVGCALAGTLTLPAQQAQAPAVDPAAPKHHATREERERAQQAFMEGAKALEKDQPRTAMADFARAAQLNPQDRRYALSIEVARQRLVYDLVQQADKASMLGHGAESRAAIAEAHRLDPDNPMVAQHLDELATDEDKPAFGAASHSLATPIVLQPQEGLRSFHLHENARDLIKHVFNAWGIQITIDESVAAPLVRYNLDNIDFATAERTLALATNTFFVPLDPMRVLVAKDTRENRTKYEREAMETFYLNGFTSEELTQLVSLAREDFGAKTAFAAPDSSTITVRAPVEDLAALKTTLDDLAQGHAELQLDVVMYEVDRTKAANLGITLPTQTTLFNVYSEAASILQQNSSLVQEIISSGLAPAGDWEAILAILVASGQVSNPLLSQPFGVFGGGLTMTGVSESGGALNMQLNSSDVHSVDQMQLRAADQQEATIKVGERYPIMSSSYSNLSAGGLSIPGLSTAGLSSTLQNLGINVSALTSAATEALPQVQYQDIGLTLNVTPHVQGPKAVSLKFDLKLSALAGASLNDVPIIDNREYQAITSLNIGESAVLVTALSRSQSDAITGIPGLSELPGFQDATNRNSNLNYSELAIVITPHIVRAVHPGTAERMILVPHLP